MDQAGNRTSVVDTGITKNYAPNNLNQYTTAENLGVTNGPDHEIQTYNGVTYLYVNDEHLRQVSDGNNTYSLAYDALNRCVKRTLNGLVTYYVYDGEKPVLEYDASGSLVGFNLYGKGIDEILERGAYGSDSQWHWYFYQQNHEGSVTHLIDASGHVIEQYRYDAFGAPTIYDGNWNGRPFTSYDNRFLFTGREYAATYRSIYNVQAFTFYEYRARAYNPQLGRFMSEDPTLFDAGDYNLFRYCHNDPIDFADAMGTDEQSHDLRDTSAKDAGGQYAEMHESAQQLLRQIAHDKALMKGLGWHPGGAIATGLANFQMNKLSLAVGGLAGIAESRSLSKPMVVGHDVESRNRYVSGPASKVVISVRHVLFEEDEQGNLKPVGKGIPVREAAYVKNALYAPGGIRTYPYAVPTDKYGRTTVDTYSVPFSRPEGYQTFTHVLFTPEGHASWNVTIRADGSYEFDPRLSVFH